MFKLITSLALASVGAAAQEMTLVQYIGSTQCLEGKQKVCQAVTLGTCVKHIQGDGSSIYTKVSKDESDGSYTVESCKEAGCKCSYPHKGFVLDECNSEYSLKLVEGKQEGCVGDSYDNEVAWATWDGKLSAAVPAEKSSDKKEESLIQMKVVTPVQHAIDAAEDTLSNGVASLTGEIEKLDNKFLEPKGHSHWVLPDDKVVVLANVLQKAEQEPVSVEPSLEYKDGESSVDDWREEYKPMHAENYYGKTIQRNSGLVWFTWMGIFCIMFAAAGAYVYSKSLSVA